MTFLMTGMTLVLIGLMTMFFMDDADPYEELFPWAWELARLMFYSGVGMIIVGLILSLWDLTTDVLGAMR